MSNKIKIFSIYHKPAIIFETDAIIPIQTGASDSQYDLDMLKDNTGDNISHKNINYAELTANYWVWKNYLKENQDTEYIGFCHYRRFLDFGKAPNENNCFCEVIESKKFNLAFQTAYNSDTIWEEIKDYDVILPKLLSFENTSTKQQYSTYHPTKDMESLINIIKTNYPEYVDVMNEFLEGNNGYYCLNYVMKKSLFEEYMKWVFDILEKLEQVSDWSDYKDYNSQRTPAYLIERFFNVWLRYKIKNDNIKVLERHSYIIKNIEHQKILPGISCTIIDDKKIFKIFGIKISLKNKSLLKI